MEVNYSFETLKTGEIFMKIEPNKLISGDNNRIGEWLVTDFRDGCYAMPKVNKVIENVSEEELIWMNGYKVIVRRDYTTIRFNFEEDCPEIKPCTLPTKMLYEILEIWIKAYAEHNQKKN